MSLSTTQYGYIIDPMVPFTDDKGKTIKNGFIRVFMAGTSTPVITYRNYDGATNQEKIELDNSGRVKHNVIGSKGSLYKVVVYNILHSQENPLLTVDKIAVLGASINATGATIVTGLDSVTVQEENFLKATVEGTEVELALDPTEVTDEVSTSSAAVTAAPDYVVPLLDKTGVGDSKKIALANLFKFALDWISRLATTISSFASVDYIAVSNTTDGTRKMSKDDLLRVTAQNALAGNVAPAFDPTRTSENPYKAGESVTYTDGMVYTFKVDHYGAWSDADVVLTELMDYIGDQVIFVVTALDDPAHWESNLYHAQDGMSTFGTKSSSISFMCAELTLPQERDGWFFNFTACKRTSNQGGLTTAGIVFYDVNRVPIAGYPFPMGTETVYDDSVEIPTGTKYIGVTYFAGRTDFKYSYSKYSLGSLFEKTKEKEETLYDEVYDDTELCDYAALSINNELITTSTKLSVTSLIYVKGAKELEFDFIKKYSLSSDFCFAFYDVSKNMILQVLAKPSDSEQTEKIKISVPSDAVYFRTTFWNEAYRTTYDVSFSLKITRKEKLKFLPKCEKYKWFSPSVDNSINTYWNTADSNQHVPNIKKTTSVLALPDNYDPDGKPVPVIMYSHGLSHGVWFGTWGSTADFLQQKDHWLAQGYAVFDCNGACNNNKQVGFASCGAPQFTEAFFKTWKYIKEHYNVEYKLCIVGGSAGGLTALNFCFDHQNEVKALCCLSCYVSARLDAWANVSKQIFVDYLGFTNTTDYEEDKTIGYDPNLRKSSDKVFLPVPSQFMFGKLEEDVSAATHDIVSNMKAFAASARSLGCRANLRGIEGEGHNIVSGAVQVVDDEVVEFFNQF